MLLQLVCGCACCRAGCPRAARAARCLRSRMQNEVRMQACARGNVRARAVGAVKQAQAAKVGAIDGVAVAGTGRSMPSAPFFRHFRPRACVKAHA